MEKIIRKAISSDVTTIKDIIDITVGKKFYSTQEISNMIDSDKGFLNVALNEQGDAIGYNYNYITSFDEVVSSFNMEQIVFENSYQYAGVIKSIGVLEEYRYRRIGQKLIFCGVEELFTSGVDIILTLAWKKGDTIPLEKILLAQGFLYKSEIIHPWYNIDMECSFCMVEHCICNAALFYKLRHIKG